MNRVLVLAAFLSVIGLSPALADDTTLRSALDGNAPPFASPTLDGGVEGLAVDTVHTIADRLGRKLDLTPTQFSDLIPSLQAGTYDLLSAPMTASKERADQMLFTEGLWNTDYQFILPASGPDVKDLSDLKGKTIAVNKGTVYDSWARSQIDAVGWTVESYASTNDAVQAVLSGRAAAALQGDAQALWIPKQNPAVKSSTYRYVTGLVFAYAVSKDNPDLRKQVEDIIECMKTDGTAATLFKKWMGVDPVQGTATLTVFPGYGIPGLPGYDPTPHTPTCK